MEDTPADPNPPDVHRQDSCVRLLVVPDGGDVVSVEPDFVYLASAQQSGLPGCFGTDASSAIHWVLPCSCSVALAAQADCTSMNERWASEVGLFIWLSYGRTGLSLPCCLYSWVGVWLGWFSGFFKHLQCLAGQVCHLPVHLVEQVFSGFEFQGSLSCCSEYVWGNASGPALRHPPVPGF